MCRKRDSNISLWCIKMRIEQVSSILNRKVNRTSFVIDRLPASGQKYRSRSRSAVLPHKQYIRAHESFLRPGMCRRGHVEVNERELSGSCSASCANKSFPGTPPPGCGHLDSCRNKETGWKRFFSPCVPCLCDCLIPCGELALLMKMAANMAHISGYLCGSTPRWLLLRCLRVVGPIHFRLFWGWWLRTELLFRFYERSVSTCQLCVLFSSYFCFYLIFLVNADKVEIKRRRN